jgi:regulator of protease activity HflC (stomatin/prohibitin superfamily)
MGQAFEWLNRIFDLLWRFVPKPIIVGPQAQALVTRTVLLRDLARGRWRPAAKLAVAEPGFHVFWPLMTEFEIYPVAYQTTPLVAQDIVTAPDAEGKRVTVTARGMLSYEIEDLTKILAHTYDPEDTIRDEAATAFHDVLCHQSWDDLVRGQGRTLDTKLRNKAKEALTERGIKVHKFTLTSLAPARVLRVVQSTAQEGELGK